MFGSQNHKSSAVERIRSGCVNRDLLVRALHREINLRAVRLTDPVGLHLLYLLRPVQLIQIL